MIHKKGVGVCFSAHPGTVGSRIALSHRIDNAVSPRQHGLYINKVYRNVPRDASLSSVCCEIRNLRDSQFTTTDVRKRLSHIYDRPLYPFGLTSDVAKIGIIFETPKDLEEKSEKPLSLPPPVEVEGNVKTIYSQKVAL